MGLWHHDCAHSFLAAACHAAARNQSVELRSALVPEQFAPSNCLTVACITQKIFGTVETSCRFTTDGVIAIWKQVRLGSPDLTQELLVWVSVVLTLRKFTHNLLNISSLKLVHIRHRKNPHISADVGCTVLYQCREVVSYRYLGPTGVSAARMHHLAFLVRVCATTKTMLVAIAASTLGFHTSILLCCKHIEDQHQFVLKAGRQVMEHVVSGINCWNLDASPIRSKTWELHVSVGQMERIHTIHKLHLSQCCTTFGVLMRCTLLCSDGHSCRLQYQKQMPVRLMVYEMDSLKVMLLWWWAGKVPLCYCHPLLCCKGGHGGYCMHHGWSLSPWYTQYMFALNKQRTQDVSQRNKSFSSDSTACRHQWPTHWRQCGHKSSPGVLQSLRLPQMPATAVQCPWNHVARHIKEPSCPADNVLAVRIGLQGANVLRILDKLPRLVGFTWHTGHAVKGRTGMH